MSKFEFTLQPPDHWDALCAKHKALFHSPKWQSVLSQAFGSQTVYGWDANTHAGLAITVFRAGPFRVGYVGFPTGGSMGVNPLEPDMVLSWKEAHFPIKLHCLRVPVSAFDHSIALKLPFQKVPETAITKLQEWQDNRLPDSVGRNIRKATRAGIEIRDANLSNHGDTMFHLYRETIKRHRGLLRYNAKYFRALISYSLTTLNLRCLLASFRNQIAGFLVVALANNTVYYMHGAVNPALQRYRPGDLLFHSAIKSAQKEGISCFNMMASPADQPSLVRYKEKWGGITKQHKTYTLTIRALPHLCFRAAETFYRVLR